MKYEYIPAGVCSRKMEFEIRPDGSLHSLTVYGGCHGNLQGIAALVEGMPAEEAIKRLRGIDCRGKGTSCPDQFAKAIAEAIAAESNVDR